MQCDLCGREGATQRSNVEGAELVVCQKCAGYGTNLRSAPVQAPQKKIIVAPSIQQRPISNAGDLVKQAREKLGITQKDLALKMNEHQSLLQKVETGHTLSIDMARKLEKALHITLIEAYQEVKTAPVAATTSGLTIGDLLTLGRQ